MTERYKREYFTEVFRIIRTYSPEMLQKIPVKILCDLADMELSQADYPFEYDPSRSFKEQGVKREAVAFLVYLHREYLASDEERAQIDARLAENSRKKAAAANADDDLEDFDD